MSISIELWIPRNEWPSAQEVQKAIEIENFPISLTNFDSLNRDDLFWPHCDDIENDVVVKLVSGTVLPLHIPLETRRIRDADVNVDPQWGVDLPFIEAATDDGCYPVVGDMYSTISIGSRADEWIPIVYIGASLVKHFKAGVIYGDVYAFNGDTHELVRNAQHMWENHASNQ